MKKLTSEEMSEIWVAGMSFDELIQSAYERGYKDHAIDQEHGLRRLIKDVANTDSLEDRDTEWIAWQKNRNR
jgi:hypothetical protein